MQIIGENFWDCICVDKHLPRFEELAYVVPHFDALTRVVGEQGWCSGESSRLPTMWPGFKSRRRRHMWVEFVVGSLSCSERFFSWYSDFPLSSKTNIFKFQFHQESGRRRTTTWMCYPQIVIYLFIYFSGSCLRKALFIFFLIVGCVGKSFFSLVSILWHSFTDEILAIIEFLFRFVYRFLAVFN